MLGVACGRWPLGSSCLKPAPSRGTEHDGKDTRCDTRPAVGSLPVMNILSPCAPLTGRKNLCTRAMEQRGTCRRRDHRATPTIPNIGGQTSEDDPTSVRPDCASANILAGNPAQSSRESKRCSANHPNTPFAPASRRVPGPALVGAPEARHAGEARCGSHLLEADTRRLETPLRNAIAESIADLAP